MGIGLGQNKISEITQIDFLTFFLNFQNELRSKEVIGKLGAISIKFYVCSM